MNTIPLLLVHGIYETGRRFNRLRAFLQANGFTTLETMDIHPCNGSISFEEMGTQVKQAALTLKQSTQVEKIDIVAFSMGALASRYFIQRQGGKEIVRRFISLAGPHRGTYTAYLHPGAGCRQMQPNSNMLQDLLSDTDPWEETDVYSFWTPLDLMIIPASSSQLPGADNRTFPVLIHPWVASDVRVMTYIAQTLKQS